MQGVVSTARALMQAVKDVFGSAEGLTINFNLGAVAQQAQTATAAVKDFGNAVGTVPPAQLKSLQPEVSGPVSQYTKEELSRQLDLLEIERKSLEIERAKAGANETAIKARLEEIKQQKLQLGLQKNQLEYATKYGEQTESMTSKMNQFYQDIGKKVVGLPTDFAKNVGGEFMSDLGISGQGAIPNLINEGVNYIFQVQDMQSALTAQRTLVNKQAAGVTQR
jgi:CII-binding regulator of phage lambda lysogenization HflD